MVTVIICAYNQLQYTKVCIQSILERTGQAFKLMLVDNGSTDGTGDYYDKIKEIKPNTTILKHSENINLSVSYNMAVDCVNTDYVAMIGNDQVVCYNWFKPIEKLLEDPKVGLASCQYVPMEMVVDQITPENVMKITEEWYQNSNISKEPAIEIKANQPWCLRTKLLKEIGGFDPGYKYGWFMDCDCYNRILLKGYKVLQTKESWTYHFGSKTIHMFRFSREEWDEPGKNHFVEKFKNCPNPEFTPLWGRGGHGEMAVEGL